jgi:gas vesicle protein
MTTEVKEANKGGLLLGIMIGGAVGAVSALLVAPKTGTKMREDLSNTYRSINEKTQQLASTVAQKTQDIAKSVSGHTTDVVDKAKEVEKLVVNTWEAKKDDVVRDMDKLKPKFD